MKEAEIALLRLTMNFFDKFNSRQKGKEKNKVNRPTYQMRLVSILKT